MGIIDWFKEEPQTVAQAIKLVESEDKDPVSIKDIEDVVKLINATKDIYKINCYFELTLNLNIGKFCVDSDSFKDIRVLKKTKSEPERLVISYCDALLCTETTINLEHIIGIIFHLKYRDTEGEENV